MTDVMEDLIASAYGSLTGPESHAAFLGMLAGAFRSHVVARQIDQPDHIQTVLAHYDAQGNAMDELDVAASRQVYVNPWFDSPLVANLLRNGVAHEEGCLAPQALRATEFYADILKPFDIFHSMGFVLELGRQTSVVTISRSHHVGYYDNDELALAKRLLPHLRTLHAIQQVVAGQSIADAARGEPAWTLTADGRICGMNHAAQGGLAQSMLRIHDNRLRPVNAQDLAGWQAAMVDVLGGRRPHRRVPLRDADGTPRFILHLAPCRREAFLTWLLDDVPAMVAILQSMHPNASSLLVELPRLYGLTPAECRVAVKLLELDSLTCIADSLCRSEQTVRSQLKSIYAKTGTHSQTQLLKLLLGLSAS